MLLSSSLSSSLRLSPRLAVSISVAMAFSTSSSNGKIYELRTYNIVPEKVPTFIQLTNAHLHLRTAHSTLLGYWTCELGALNEVIHLWEYGEKFTSAVSKHRYSFIF